MERKKEWEKASKDGLLAGISRTPTAEEIRGMQKLPPDRGLNGEGREQKDPPSGSESLTPKEKKPPGLKLETALETLKIAQTTPEARPALGGLITEGELALVTGLPGTGKTIWALNYGLSVVVQAESYLDREIGIAGHVVYINLDMPARKFRARIAKMLTALPAPGDVSRFHSTTTSLNVATGRDFALLIEAVEEVHPVLLIVDAFGFTHRADESQSHEIVPVLDRFKNIRDAYGITVLVLAHDRKDGTTVLGSVMKTAIVDTILRMREVDDGGGLRFTLGHGEKARDCARERPFSLRLDPDTLWLSCDESARPLGGRPAKVTTETVREALSDGPTDGQDRLVRILCTRTGCGERQAKEAIAKAKDEGLIEIDRPGGGRRRAVYRLTCGNSIFGLHHTQSSGDE